MSNYLVFVDGLDGVISGLNELDPAIVKAVRMAINRSADSGRVEAAKRIGQELNFPSRYITGGANGKLVLSTKASDNSLEAVITGRSSNTSLARFANSRSPVASRKNGGVTVSVKRGQAKFMPRAFLIKLKSGNRSLDEAFNLGLAIRLRPGESIDNKKIRAVRMQSNLYLLYGPSVSQAFINSAGSGVAKDVTPFILDKMESEFLRLLKI